MAKRLERELDDFVRQYGQPDPMRVIVENGLPFVRRMEQILQEVGLSWSQWKQNPHRSGYDERLAQRKSRG